MFNLGIKYLVVESNEQIFLDFDYLPQWPSHAIATRPGGKGTWLVYVLGVWLFNRYNRHGMLEDFPTS